MSTFKIGAAEIRYRLCLILFLLFYFPFLFYFYLTFVPLIKPYQLTLIPILAIILLLSAFRLEWGWLSFLFFLPLTGNLPYYFGLNENIPQAPVSLILFLFFFAGYILNQNFFSPRKDLSFVSSWRWHPLQPFLGFFLGLVFLSGLIAFLRYSNFFPFLTDGLHELVVNVNGVRAGGARMSVIFSSLNMATGPLLSFILLPWLQLPDFRQKLMKTFCLAFFLSLLFNGLQLLFFPQLGRLPTWIQLEQFQATYKDPNSFGFYAAAFLPAFFILALSGKIKPVWLEVILIAFSLLGLATSGSRSCWLAFSLGSVSGLLLISQLPEINQRRKLFSWLILFFLITFIFLAFPLLSSFTLTKRLHLSWDFLKKGMVEELFSGKIALWSMAWEMFRRFPLSGVGTGAYIVELPNFLYQAGRPMFTTDSAENLFFQVLAELGLFGAILIFIIAAKALACSLKERARLKENQEKLMAIALGSSLVACLVNFIFHSYIGGFEAKYLFWFLFTYFLSILCAPDKKSGQEKMTEKINEEPNLLKIPSGESFSDAGEKQLSPKRERGRLFILRPRLFMILITILFIFSHFFASFTELSLVRRTRDFGWLQDFGFYNWEKDWRGFDFRWAKKKAGLALERLGSQAVLMVHASHPDIEKNPVKLKVYQANDWFKKEKELFSLEIKDKQWHQIEIDLENERAGQERRQKLLEGKDNLKMEGQGRAELAAQGGKGPYNFNLVFEANRDWQPGRVLRVPDPRKIAFALGDIWYQYPTLPEEEIKVIKTIPATSWTGHQGSELGTSGSAELSFSVEDDNTYLRLQVRGQKAGGLGPLFKVYLNGRVVAKTMLLTEEWTYLYLPLSLPRGEYQIKVEFLNDFYDPSLGQDRNLFLGPLSLLQK
jgi:hypothetical protein